MKPTLTIEDLCAEAAKFANIESLFDEPVLYGVTDGKAIGTYLEHKFTAYLAEKYSFQQGNSASGIDLPALEIAELFSKLAVFQEYLGFDK
jgi:hypothetical protein